MTRDDPQDFDVEVHDLGNGWTERKFRPRNRRRRGAAEVLAMLEGLTRELKAKPPEDPLD